ncbi:hypothetical protein FB567DRAFT_558923 [Paraphoma chrysanthemicola]|uniref:Uncharacterized protein n=1 Tax=Paraphoma chrysanthemicola TaxID=798071 RepID=A0A8K0RDS5_9PLEO|nr:hypothetical protein FB567DRAFT_558923 [Paraphoma chrysanthemicola]
MYRPESHTFGVNIWGNLRYRATPVPHKATYHASDITIVIPTIDLAPATLHRVISSILRHPVSQLIIPTAGTIAEAQIVNFQAEFCDPRVVVLHRDEISRRQQTAQAMPHVRTSLVIIQDDHTYWQAEASFVQSIVAPLEDSSTGGVSTVLEARHRQHPTSFAGFWNFLGMTYLHYLHEYIFFGKVGPLNADDDKFHTRWLIDHGWKIKLQAGPESVMMTELGEWPKFSEQILRWTRTTWRSNPRQLTHKMSWFRQPYTTFSLMMWFFRMSLVQEVAMFWLLRAALKDAGELALFPLAAAALYAWIITMKIVKILPHFRKHPQDLVYFPAYLVFGYWCTLVKVWAMLTCWNASWATAKSSDTGGLLRLSTFVGTSQDFASRAWKLLGRANKRRVYNAKDA